jgi:hypothetical protein
MDLQSSLVETLKLLWIPNHKPAKCHKFKSKLTIYSLEFLSSKPFSQLSVQYVTVYLRDYFETLMIISIGLIITLLLIPSSFSSPTSSSSTPWSQFHSSFPSKLSSSSKWFSFKKISFSTPSTGTEVSLSNQPH